MTIATVSDDETFEQIKKQLNRMVEVIKVIDFTDIFIRIKEILYVKVRDCSLEEKIELFQIAETFKGRVIDRGKRQPASGICPDRCQKMMRLSSCLKKNLKISKWYGAEAWELNPSA